MTAEIFTRSTHTVGQGQEYRLAPVWVISRGVISPAGYLTEPVWSLDRSLTVHTSAARWLALLRCFISSIPQSDARFLCDGRTCMLRLTLAVRSIVIRLLVAARAKYRPYF